MQSSRPDLQLPHAVLQGLSIVYNIAIVIPWFGRDLKGGAELHAWHLASRLASRGHKVDVITTCCRSHSDDWGTNHYEAGETREIDQFTVRRFPVASRERARFDAVNHRMLKLPRTLLRPGVSPVEAEDERIFVRQLIRSPKLLAYLARHKDAYDAVLLLPYLYGPVIEGVHLAADRALLQPCLHDEVYAYLPAVAGSIFAARRLLFLSEGEQRLATRLYGPGIIPKSTLVGAGVEIQSDQACDDSLLPMLGARYILCLGRKDPGKNTDFLVHCFEQHKRRYPDSQLRLVIAGPGQITSPSDRSGLIELGVVSDAQKRSLLRNCTALFHPSENESFSRVIMEAWLSGRPVAGHASCLATATAISERGGWLAGDTEEWVSLFATIETTSDADLDAIGEKGREYANDVANWERVIARYERVIEELKGANSESALIGPVRSKVPVHQVLPNVAYGDAISNHALWIRDALLELGHPSEIFAAGIDPKLAKDVHRLAEPSLVPTDAIIYHHSIGSAVTPTVVAHQGAKCLIYHNITPHRFLEPYLPLHAKLCREGRNDLSGLAAAFSLSVGDSNYNAMELAERGFRDPGVLPICVDPRKWQLLPNAELMARLQDGRTNVLFVGRLSPNKRQEDLIYAFSRFRMLDSSARLILVGTPVVQNDLYVACLRRLCEKLDLADAVEFTGQVSDEELVAYYRTAHLFWSMSEHEGFCVPLIEAMWFDVPVLAYSSSAVVETLDGAGYLFSSKKDSMHLAQIAFSLVHDPTLRNQIVEMQRSRRAAFLHQPVCARLIALLSRLLPSKAGTLEFPSSIINADSIRRIAVVKLDHIGDLLLASPVFASLKHRFPLATITAVVAPGSVEVLRNHPYVTECVPFDAVWFWREIPNREAIATALARNADAMRHLLQGRFDLVVNLRSDLANVHFAASLPHTRLLSYTNHSPYPFLITDQITRTRAMHICDQHRALLAEIDAHEWSRPRLYPTAADYASVASKVFLEARTVAIAPGAGISLKRWPAIKFRELVRRLRLRGLPIAIVGAAAERELGNEITAGTDAANLCGNFNLLELAVYLESCAALVTNDSAPMHIGAAAGITVIYITRPNAADEFAPVGNNHLRSCAQHCAEPCEGFDAEKRQALRAVCPCIQSITVDDVEAKLWKALASTDHAGTHSNERNPDRLNALRLT